MRLPVMNMVFATLPCGAAATQRWKRTQTTTRLSDPLSIVIVPADNAVATTIASALSPATIHARGRRFIATCPLSTVAPSAVPPAMCRSRFTPGATHDPVPVPADLPETRRAQLAVPGSALRQVKQSRAGADVEVDIDVGHACCLARGCRPAVNAGEPWRDWDGSPKVVQRGGHVHLIPVHTPSKAPLEGSPAKSTNTEDRARGCEENHGCAFPAAAAIGSARDHERCEDGDREPQGGQDAPRQHRDEQRPGRHQQPSWLVRATCRRRRVSRYPHHTVHAAMMPKMPPAVGTRRRMHGSRPAP